MTPVGYAHLIETLRLRVLPLPRSAYVSSSVNRRIDGEDRILFSTGVALENTLAGHLEFALRHEGANLEVIDAVFEHLPPAELIGRLRVTPSGEHIRRACFLWERLTGKSLDAGVTVKAGYVDLFAPAEYVTAPVGIRPPHFRVRNNALGTPDFCPVVKRAALAADATLGDLLQEAQRTLDAVKDRQLYHRAISYLYLSETTGSYAIESETPSSDKQDRFAKHRCTRPLQPRGVLPHPPELAGRCVWADYFFSRANRRPPSRYARLGSVRQRPGTMCGRTGQGRLCSIRILLPEPVYGWKWPPAPIPHPPRAGKSRPDAAEDNYPLK